MFGAMDKKKMEALMKQMNMRDIKATEVIIKTEDKEIVIKNPEIIIANIMGRESYQITGKAEERSPSEPSEEDIQMIMEQTGKDRETVAAKLKELDNDLARVILELKED